MSECGDLSDKPMALSVSTEDTRQQHEQDNKQSLDDSLASNKSAKRRRKQRRGKRSRGVFTANSNWLTDYV
jgi:hypothetical protein